MTVTNIPLISPGIVRNLLKTSYFLRVPKDPKRMDRTGKQYVIPSTQDVEIDYRDWKLVEYDLITKDKLKVLKIIQYPTRIATMSSLQVINNYNDLPLTPTPGTVLWVQYGDYQGIYYYDETRNSWLSENEMLYTWNSTTDVNTAQVSLVHHASDTHPDNDVTCRVPITITAMAASQANPITSGNATRFSINRYDIDTGVQEQNSTHIDLIAVNERGVNSTTLNTQIAANSILSASRTKLSGLDKITRPALTIWYRWRLVP